MVVRMDFNRDIYQKLLSWKTEDTGKVLEVSGARQVGKTYILKKFAKENFKYSYYINMAEVSGEQFLQCVEAANQWQPGSKRDEKPLHKALYLFDKSFSDNKDTIILIDEIQESSKVYNLIRTFAREFQCYVVVTGSYLGRLLEKEFFLPAGDIDTLTLGTLNFPEFLEIFEQRELYESLDLYGGSSPEQYNQIRNYFDIYQRIGGYPSVVKKYIQYKDFDRCDAEIWQLIDIFTNESKRYFNNIMETNIFEKLFHSIAVTLIKEKQGVRDLIEQLSKIVYKEESGRYTKQMVHRAIGWLQASHILSYAGKAIDCDYLNVKENARFYFLDLGMAQHFLKQAGADHEVIKGIVAENFVFLTLLRRIRKEIAGSTPWFAIYEKTKGELDFYVRSLIDTKNYGLEVKSEDSEAKTAKALLKDKKIEYLYLLKGAAYGGVTEDGKIRTVPLYLADRIQFHN